MSYFFLYPTYQTSELSGNFALTSTRQLGRACHLSHIVKILPCWYVTAMGHNCNRFLCPTLTYCLTNISGAGLRFILQHIFFHLLTSLPANPPTFPSLSFSLHTTFPAPVATAGTVTSRVANFNSTSTYTSLLVFQDSLTTALLVFQDNYTELVLCLTSLSRL